MTVKIEFALDPAARPAFVPSNDGVSGEFTLTSSAGALTVHLTHEQIDLLREQLIGYEHLPRNLEKVYATMPTRNSISLAKLAFLVGLSGKATRDILLYLQRQYRVREVTGNMWTRDQNERLGVDPLDAITRLLKGAGGRRILEDAIYAECPDVDTDQIDDHLRFLYNSGLIRQSNGDITGYAWSKP